ncbi:DUF1634 domain-containing protein [Paraburkholderia guartelaensis]|uniref:DUF1634 domain-containing protein n=1 Tax=Paraburkholderia guartelaensis TaxID=2546446 RepID=UPI002AB6802A|nr:DUF1634 domain-containing protein [Paraburkholderia guartelaensis]
MSAPAHRLRNLEHALAVLLSRGTALACGTIMAGLLLSSSSTHHAAGEWIATAGIALFILLPMFRLAFMAAVFTRQRDYRWGTLCAFVLLLVVGGGALGVYLSRFTA